MPVVIKELVVRITSEAPRPERSATAAPPVGRGANNARDASAVVREAVEETLRILRKKKER